MIDHIEPASRRASATLARWLKRSRDMGRTTDLRREIKRRFFPVMAAAGFTVDMRDAPFFVGFRRMTPDVIQVCDIQWEKYGRPRFVINFGKCGPAGVICHGQAVRPEDVTASATPLQGRLAPGRHSSVGGWFRQDRPLIESILHLSRLRPPAEVVTTILALFHEVEDWWKDGSIGPHVRIIAMRYSRDAAAGAPMAARPTIL